MPFGDRLLRKKSRAPDVATSGAVMSSYPEAHQNPDAVVHSIRPVADPAAHPPEQHHAPPVRNHRLLRSHKSSASVASEASSSASTVSIISARSSVEATPAMPATHGPATAMMLQSGTSTGGARLRDRQRSVTETASNHSGQSHGAPRLGIPHKGYLLVKKGMLKGYERRFYFVTTLGPELFMFKDELQFDDWMARGARGLQSASAACTKAGVAPTTVCTVLRADRAGDSSALDRAIAVIAGDQHKCTSLKFLAETPEDCERWIEAFHEIQAAKRDARPMGPSAPAPISSLALPPTTPAACGGEARVGSQRRMSDASDTTSQHSSGHSSQRPATAAPAGGNVLLFAPAAGAAIALSDRKMAEARREMEALVAQGAKRPTRGGLDNPRGVTWRYGPPEFVLSDLEYLRGRTRDHDATPLESYAESCLQTLVMEATHKTVYREWTSIRHEYFYLQVNDGDKLPGHALPDTPLFGMLYLNDHEVDLGTEGPGAVTGADERRDPRAVLAEAFPHGFPMEILDVYTQPPQCHFSWRHWGRFNGRYKGVKGDGALVEVRGFGQMHIDSGRLLNLRLFFKQRDLFERLNAVAAGLAKDQGVPWSTSANATAATTATTPAATTTAQTSSNGSTTSAHRTRQNTVTGPPPTAKTRSASHAQDFAEDQHIGDFTRPGKLRANKQSSAQFQLYDEREFPSATTAA